MQLRAWNAAPKPVKAAVGTVVTVLAAVAAVLASGLVAPTAGAAENVTVHTGTIDGADYRVEVPADWNGELMLYSHGHRPPGGPNPAEVADDPLVKEWLLGEGYALAGSAYKGTGWAVEEGMTDQIALLDWIDREIGEPSRTYSWGRSMGGLQSILLAERNPRRFDGVISLCGPVAGPVANWNQRLDLGFTLKTLLDPQIQLTAIADPQANMARAQAAMAQASTTPEGRARLALANAFSNVVPWFGGPRPTTLEQEMEHQVGYPRFVFGDDVFGAKRVDVERRSGGNPSWNAGVDYAAQLARSTQGDLVRRAYAAAGLDLAADLAALKGAPRIKADPKAVVHLARFGTPVGLNRAPVITMHTTLDGGWGSEQQRWYADAVKRIGNPAELRQVFADRPNHCRWSPAEQITTIQTMVARVETGRWPSTSPADLNANAATFGPDHHRMLDFYLGEVITVQPSFAEHSPAKVLRPFPF